MEEIVGYIKNVPDRLEGVMGDLVSGKLLAGARKFPIEIIAYREGIVYISNIPYRIYITAREVIFESPDGGEVYFTM